MSYSYDTKRRNAVPEIRSDIPDSVQQSFNAIQNVDIHSGRRLDLESSLKSRIEQNTGFKMDNVELRESSDAAAMDAKAFAKGNVVHFAPGQFDQHSAAGQHLIEHELTHVAQQARGGVRADVDGLNVNASEHFESQADSGMSFSGGALQALPTMNAEAAPIQGAFGGIKKFFKKMFGKGGEEAAAPEPAPAPHTPSSAEIIRNVHDEQLDARIARMRGEGASELDVRKARRQFGFGRLLKARNDEVTNLMNEFHSENAEIEAYMRENGFSDEEIQAQLAFQRVNKAEQRQDRFFARQADIRNNVFTDDFDSDKEMATEFSAMGEGVRLEDRPAIARREDEFRATVCADEAAYDTANEWAERLSRRRNK